MLTISALRQKKIDEKASLKAARTEAAGLFALGTLTPEQSTKKDALKASIGAIEARIEDLDGAIENAEGLARLEGDQAIASPVVEASREDPKKGFKDHREFFVAVMNEGMGRKADKRLALVKSNMVAAVGSDEQSVAANPYGGFLVPEGILPGLLTRAVEADPFANVTRIPMDVPTINVTARVDSSHATSVSGGLSVSRRPETVIATASRQSYEKFQLNATNLTGLNYVSEELLRYSPTSVAALVAAGFQGEFLSKGVQEKILGSGVGEPEGFMNSPALITIDKELNQAADTIVYDNILKMRARCYGYENAVWVANHDTLPTLAKMTISVGVGGSVVFVPNTTPTTLLGRPVYFTEYMDKVGDLGDIALVNMTEYLEGTLQPLQSAESVHVRFEYHERTFKFWLANDGKSWWRAALTPMNSSPTLSPFVTLAERA